MTSNTDSTNPALQEEMQFRMSLLRLMTSPHEESPSRKAPVRAVVPEYRQLEELAVLVPRRQ